jgi:hypothetical protein
VGLLALGLASVAAAAPVTPGTNLNVAISGNESGQYYSGVLGCADGAEGSPLFHCAGSNLNISYGSESMRIDYWNMTFDTDPSVGGSLAVTNTGAVTSQFTLTFTLPIAPIPGSTLTRGSVQGGGTDLNSNGVTIAAPFGSALYWSMIDGAQITPLYSDPTSFSGGPDSSPNVPQATFGNPIYVVGPAVATSIGLRFDFTLTPGDTATFSGVHIVLVPEPATGALVALGLVALAARRRR